MIPYCKICSQKMNAFSFNTENAQWKFPSTTYSCQFCRIESSISPNRSRYYCVVNVKNNTIIQEEFHREKDDYFLYIIKSIYLNYIEVKKSILGQPTSYLMHLPKDDKLNYHQMFDKVEKLLPFL